MENVGKIEDRLNGIIRHRNKPKGLPISVSGQVSSLIEVSKKFKPIFCVYKLFVLKGSNVIGKLEPDVHWLGSPSLTAHIIE